MKVTEKKKKNNRGESEIENCIKQKMQSLKQKEREREREDKVKGIEKKKKQ